MRAMRDPIAWLGVIGAALWFAIIFERPVVVSELELDSCATFCHDIKQPVSYIQVSRHATMCFCRNMRGLRLDQNEKGDDMRSAN